MFNSFIVIAFQSKQHIIHTITSDNFFYYFNSIRLEKCHYSTKQIISNKHFFNFFNLNPFPMVCVCCPMIVPLYRDVEKDVHNCKWSIIRIIYAVLDKMNIRSMTLEFSNKIGSYTFSIFFFLIQPCHRDTELPTAYWRWMVIGDASLIFIQFASHEVFGSVN